MKGSSRKAFLRLRTSNGPWTSRKSSGDKLGRILIDLGFVAPRDVLQTLAEQLEIALLSGDDFPAVLPELKGIAPRYMRQFRFLPVSREDSSVMVAMSDPLDFRNLGDNPQFHGTRSEDRSRRRARPTRHD